MSHVASLGLKKYYFNLNCMKVHENWSVKRVKSSYFRCHTSGINQGRKWEWEKTKMNQSAVNHQDTNLLPVPGAPRLESDGTREGGGGCRSGPAAALPEVGDRRRGGRSGRRSTPPAAAALPRAEERERDGRTICHTHTPLAMVARWR